MAYYMVGPIMFPLGLEQWAATVFSDILFGHYSFRQTEVGVSPSSHFLTTHGTITLVC